MQASLRNPAQQHLTEQLGEIYQAVDIVTFEKDSMATGLAIDSFNLEGEFKAMDINVLASNATVRAELEKPNTATWIVRLPRPLPLKRIHVQELRLTQLEMAEEFIVAGFFDHLISESHLSLSAAAVIDDRISRVREQAGIRLRNDLELRINAGTIDIFPVVGDKIIEQSIATYANNELISDLTLEAFAIRATNSLSFSRQNLFTANHSISVYVDSQPQSLSLGFAPVIGDEVQLDEMVGLSALNLDSNQTNVPLENNAQIWKSAIQNYLDDHFATSDGNEFKVGIVMRSENPCQFERESFSSHYHLTFRDRQMYPDIDLANPESPEEQRQSFSGTHWQSHSFDLSLPEGATLRSAILPFKQTLNNNAFIFVDQAPHKDWIENARGVELTTDQWTGGVFELNRAQAVRYLLVPLMATTENSTCALEIREDINNQPDGPILTEQSITLSQIGNRVWMSVTLDETLPLYSKKLWWLIKTTQGSAVQFVENATDSSITYFSLSQTGGPGSVFRITRGQKVQPFFAKDNSEGQKLYAYLKHDNNYLSLPITDSQKNKLQHFDLLPRLLESNAPINGSALLQIASLLKGNTVLYPVEMSYELGVGV